MLRLTVAGACLLAPAVALLWLPWYTREGPELMGVPFFYWYQFAWVPATSVLLLIAYLLLRRGDPRRSRPPVG
ncbi:hypothetical protein AA958_11945 [Streptomyces sp. CNQ-509]|uniref:DUF3311 domain-containing protein n=1 Tax=unclassified Streptomyces TaxID=2593676 RepID=UPI00062DFD45|nr:DUF3311 domain-containing protein [Streptomyces sp. CNQ-509]AKH82827.1 hypothetical protein AA958_11945 [Streptomyces sp. CNQ-509]